MLRSILVYSLMAGMQTFAIVYDILFIPHSKGNWLFKLEWLTIVFMVVYTFYLILSAFRSWTHATRTRKANMQYSLLDSVVDSLYSVFVFPIGVFVCTVFWLLYAIDRELIHPIELDDIVPQWLNHMMHSVPVLFIIIDTFLVCHHLPSRINGLIMHVAIIVTYEISLLLWFLNRGNWAYPILDVLDNQHRVLFFLATMIFSLMLFYLGHLLNYIVWGEAAYAPRKQKSRIN